MFAEKSIYYNNTSNDKNCQMNCREECEYIILETTVSNALFPTDTYSEILVHNENISSNYDDNYIDPEDYSLIKSSVLAVNVYYRQFRYYEIWKIEVWIKSDKYWFGQNLSDHSNSFFQKSYKSNILPSCIP